MKNLEKEGLKITLSREYEFEGQKYKEIDLSALENITASEMIKAENAAKKSNNTEVLPEMTMVYACHIAYSVTNIPIEFFMQLKAKDAVKVKSAIRDFLL